jgi:hypothetical protein
MAEPMSPEPLRSSGGTTTLVDPELRESEVSDEVFHYVRKDKIAESAVMGIMVQALCGAVFPVTKTPKPGSPVCSACKEMLDMLRSFGGDGDGDSSGGGSG